MADGLGGVEVIVHCRAELDFQLGALLRNDLTLRNALNGIGRRLQRFVESAQSGLGILEVLVGKIDRGTIMGSQDKKAHDLRIVALQNIANGKEVTQGLAHLLLVDIDKAVVQPVLDERLAGGSFRLGDLVFVVREDQVAAAAMDVKSISQQ